MSTQPGTPADLTPRAEHPHRCTAGHRWQHDGPTAVSCRIPTYDRVSGDLPFVSPSECPVCSGRGEMLVREPHTHYCNMCDGEWEHEGRCLDSLAACCPWCFPKPGAEPAPGARRGPHFHFCSECGQNWRHATGCSAPLRAALDECTGCQSPPSLPAVEPRAPAQVIPVREPRVIGRRLRPFALPVGIAAMALLSIPIWVKGYSAIRTLVADSLVASSRAPVRQKSIDKPAPPPSSTPQAAAPMPEVSTPSVDSSPTTDTARSNVASLPPAPRISPPKKEIRRTPTAERAAEPATPAPRPRIERSREPDVPSHSATAPTTPAPSTPTPSMAAPPAARAPAAPPSKPAPSVARSEPVSEPPSRSPETSSSLNESAAIAMPVRADAQSIPGAPPIKGLSGSSALDTSLDGHPRRVTR
jgi:hypothetical protein